MSSSDHLSESRDPLAMRIRLLAAEMYPDTDLGTVESIDFFQRLSVERQQEVAVLALLTQLRKKTGGTLEDILKDVERYSRRKHKKRKECGWGNI